MEIDGHGAVVIGGASGLGEHIARHLAMRGADVTILDQNAQRAASVAADICGYSQHCEITDAASVATGITSAMARFGQAPRIAVNCAGISKSARIINREGEVSTSKFKQLIDINISGTYYFISYAAQGMMDLPVLAAGERGVIINITPAADEVVEIGEAGNRASSAASASMCASAAREFMSIGVRAIAIAPGRVYTSIREGSLIDKVVSIGDTAVSCKRQSAVSDLTRLVSDVIENPSLNGTVIRLDGEFQ